MTFSEVCSRLNVVQASARHEEARTSESVVNPTTIFFVLFMREVADEIICVNLRPKILVNLAVTVACDLQGCHSVFWGRAP